jgi:riboflavin biosynthesis pyrimidine reductase
VSGSVISDRIRALYGADLADDPRAARGVLHVAAVWRGGASALTTLRIDVDTPRSRTDAFVLGLARARADAIVTTGEILRREPQLSHALDEGEGAEALLAWRQKVLGKRALPTTVVLTSGRNLDLTHPVFRSGRKALIFTDAGGEDRLGDRARERGIELAVHPEPSLMSLLEHARGSLGHETVLVEAGQSTTGALYESPGLVDELLLSICETDSLPASVRGAPFTTEGEIASAGLTLVGEHVSDEESGPWRFRRYVRRVA